MPANSTQILRKINMKQCIHCGETKPLDDFGNDRRRKDGKFPYCKSCYNEMRRNPVAREQARKRVKAARDASPELRKARVNAERERRYQKLYGISTDEYEKMLAFQEGGCAICGRKPKNLRLSVDHDHRTGEVRGLLCHICNKTLHYNVDSDWLFEAYEYIENPPAGAALGRTPIGQIGSIKRKRRKKKKAVEMTPEIASNLVEYLTDNAP